MRSRTNRTSKTWKQRVEELSALLRCAADALGISQGEFRVWYGSPLLLPPGRR